MCIHIVQ
jgi:hypothetical protein